eukprot:gene13424-biopygen3637
MLKLFQGVCSLEHHRSGLAKPRVERAHCGALSAVVDQFLDVRDHDRAGIEAADPARSAIGMMLGKQTVGTVVRRNAIAWGGGGCIPHLAGSRNVKWVAYQTRKTSPEGDPQLAPNHFSGLVPSFRSSMRAPGRTRTFMVWDWYLAASAG